MRKTKRLLKRTIIILLTGYVLICVGLYFFQEQMIFLPEKLSTNYPFHFTQPYKEMTIKTNSGKALNSLLFKADSAKGVIFYLHGNEGSLRTWGQISQAYTELRYDVFMLDYPGYGKSTGSIAGQDELFSDIQSAYDTVKNIYGENRMVVLGYSIGTGPAAQIASTNNPKLLILQAPYYSLTDIVRQQYPIIPTFILKYPFKTYEYLQACKMPVVIFHGDADEVIYYGSSLKLKQFFKAGDTLITLPRQGHLGFTENPQYVEALKGVLER